jgi:tetratricopeptide (TPR) repeat protein
MARCRRILFVSSYLVISPIVLIIIMESGLWGAHAVTGHHRLATLEVKSAVVPISDDTIRIAIYGGSSAAGYNSEASLDLIMTIMLSAAYPDLNFHITNFAGNGAPFHRHQAEQLKSSIQDFDVHLVYAGHNETANYYDDVGYWQDDKNKSQRSLQPFGESDFSLMEWFREKSRILAITEKLNVKYFRSSSTTPELLKFLPPRPATFEQNKTIPPENLNNILINFEADLREISTKAEVIGNMVIFSNIPSHEEYAPLFSVHTPGLEEIELQRFQAFYDSGVDAYNLGDFTSAINDFLSASEVDDQPAILNYRLGRAHMELGNTDVGREYLRKSIDNDGLPLRAFSSLGDISQTVAKEFSGVHFLDSVSNFRNALDSGLTNNDLFSDFQHPTAIGHSIIALGFIAEMQKSGPLQGKVMKTKLPTLEPASLDEFVTDLGVPNWFARHISYYRMRWHLFIGELAAEPAYYASQSNRYIDNLLELSEQQPEDLALASMFRAYVAAQLGDYAKAVDLAESSLDVSPSLVKNLLSGKVYVGSRHLTGNWMDEFARVGLNFSDDGSTLLASP